MRLVAWLCLLLATAPYGFAQPTLAPAHSEPEAASPATQKPVLLHGISLLGDPQLPPGFSHFPYVDPNALKGGEVALGVVGAFDSFNPYIVRGSPGADSLLVWDTLLKANADEANAEYGLLAKTIEMAPDRNWVAFNLRPEARFHDGTPVTSEDVAWTLETLRTQGKPFYRQYYADIASVDEDGPLRVVFHFKTNANRELPLIVGQMPVLPKHWFAGRDFGSPLNVPPMGSGPYQVDRFEFGRTLVMSRVKDWWARDLPVSVGLFNFDVRRTEYFRDATVALEAFKVGQTDFRMENVAKEWATSYDFPAVQKGLVIKETVRHRLPTGMQGYVMNTRRKLFQDVRVRHALAVMFDFEWANSNLFYGAYQRDDSYFSNSDLASSGVPTGAELALLDQYRSSLPAELFSQPFKLPVTDGSGYHRAELRQALDLLEQAGWHLQDRKLVDASGTQMSFEILLEQPAFERVSLPYVGWLSRLGIDARVRTVDPAQYQRLTDIYDFDMTVAVFPGSDSPGNEQLGYWSCSAANQEGGDNLAGVCDPVVDALVTKLVNAPNREILTTTAHALDRVLLWRWYVVPQWDVQSVRVAFWNKFGRPSVPVRTGVAFDSWWVDPKLDAVVRAARAGGL